MKIDFAVGGLRDVDRAFRSIGQSIVAFEKASERGARGSSAAWSRAEREREQQYAKLVKSLEKDEQQITKTETREAKAREKVASEEAKRREKIRETSATMAGRFAAQQANAEIKEAQRATRELEREHEKREKAAEKASHKRAHGLLHATLHGTGERIAKLGEMGGAILGIGAGFELADIARERLASQRAASRLSVMGRGVPGSSMNEIIGKAGEIGIATGTDKNALIAGAAQFTGATGAFGSSQRNMEFVAKLAKTTGKDVGEVYNLASSITRENKGITDEDLRRSMLAATSPGAFGRAGTGDVGAMVSKFGAGAGAFGGPRTETIAQLMGLGQMAFESTGTAKSATTAVQALSKSGLANKKGRLSQLGVKFTDGGLIESPEQMIAAVIGGTKGAGNQQMQAISKAVGPAAMAIFEPLVKTFREAEGVKKGTGIEAVKAQIRSAGAGMSEEDLDKNFAQVMSTSAEKFDKAVNTVKEALETRLAPFIDRLAEKISTMDIGKIEHFIDAVAKAAEWLIDNPWKGIGLAVSASITKDIAGAMIGNAVKNIITSMLTGGGGGGGGGVPIPPPAPSPTPSPGSLGAVGVVTALGAIVGGHKQFEAVSRGKKKGEEVVDQTMAMLNAAKTPEEVKAAAERAQGVIAEAHKQRSSFLTNINPLKQGEMTESGKAGMTVIAKEDDIKALIEALKQNTAATKQDTAKPVARFNSSIEGPPDLARIENMGSRGPQHP